jgi:hypothetical protein
MPAAALLATNHVVIAESMQDLAEDDVGKRQSRVCINEPYASARMSMFIRIAGYSHIAARSLSMPIA